jgi:hypothetical protein
MSFLKSLVFQSGFDLNVESQTWGFGGFSPRTLTRQGKLVSAEILELLGTGAVVFVSA